MLDYHLQINFFVKSFLPLPTVIICSQQICAASFPLISEKEKLKLLPTPRYIQTAAGWIPVFELGD